MIYKKILKKLIKHCWPKIIFPSIRDSIKYKLSFVTVSDRKKTDYHRLDKIKPWAFIRVCNEEKTLDLSLNSIKSVIHKGVIGYNDCTDNSEIILKNFVKSNPGFILFKYPYKVYKPDDPIYKNLNTVSIENTLAGYYNAVLEKIPRGEWFIKIDCDQVYFPNILDKSFYLPKDDNDVVSYSRLNVLLDEEKNLYVNSYTRPDDQLLIKNDGIYFENFSFYDNSNVFHACEILRGLNSKNFIYPECSNYHFFVEKESRKKYKNDILKHSVLFEDFIKDRSLMGGGITNNEFSDELLSKDFIKSIISSLK